MKYMRILITGGAGFIGSHLAEKLISLGHKVTIADNLSRGSLDNIASIKKNIKFLKLDLRKESDAIIATRNQDLVFNLAALNTGVDYDVGRTQKMFEENMLLQMMPIRAAAQNRVQTFIQISTASIYSREAMEKRSPTKETDDGGLPEPSKLGYALAKRMGENLSRWYAKSGHMRSVVARFINVYGTRDHFDSLGHFIPSIIKKIYNAKSSIEVFGSGNQKRSFLHVDDAVNALLLLAQKGENGETYNVDPQDEHSIHEIVYLIRSLMKKENIPVKFNTHLPEGSARRMLNATKIHALGWRPQHTLQQSLPDITHDAVVRLSHENS
jgi:nucleoside-diphosphate-sugar epimerase